MRSLHYVGSRRVEWRDVRDAEILGANDAVVRPLAAAACDLDAAIVVGVTPYEPPFALGHEFAGEVCGRRGGDDRHRRPRHRAVPDLVRRVPALSPRSHECVRCGPAHLDVRDR